MEGKLIISHRFLTFGKSLFPPIYLQHPNSAAFTKWIRIALKLSFPRSESKFVSNQFDVILCACLSFQLPVTIPHHSPTPSLINPFSSLARCLPFVLWIWRSLSVFIQASLMESQSTQMRWQNLFRHSFHSVFLICSLNLACLQILKMLLLLLLPLLFLTMDATATIFAVAASPF